MEISRLTFTALLLYFVVEFSIYSSFVSWFFVVVVVVVASCC